MINTGNEWLLQKYPNVSMITCGEVGTPEKL